MKRRDRAGSRGRWRSPQDTLGITAETTRFGSCRDAHPESAAGQKRTFAVQKGMSALPPKAERRDDEGRQSLRKEACLHANLVTRTRPTKATMAKATSWLGSMRRVRL